MASKPQRKPDTALFWTANKPCEEALADLSAAYDTMANEVERLWVIEEAAKAVAERRFGEIPYRAFYGLREALNA